MIKTIILMILISSNAYSMQVSCDADYKDSLPELDKDHMNVYDILSNRKYDPCKKIVKAPQSKSELCSKDGKFFQNLLCMKSGRMGFANNKGLFGLPTGVCWWHSQFHRNATYLTFYSPDKAKIDLSTKEGEKELKKKIKEIIKMKGVVEIPGYSSLKEFTEDPKVEAIVQKELQKWMGRDSFLKMQWVNGLFVPNNYSVRSKEEEFYMGQDRWIRDPFKDDDEYKNEKRKKKAMNEYKRKTYNSKEKEQRKKEKTIKHQNKEVTELFDIINKDQIGYIVLQYPGLTAHAEIVFDAKKYVKDGQEIYEFKVQDSTYQSGNWDPKFKSRAYSKITFKDGVWYIKRNGSGDSSYSNYEEINIGVQKNRQLKKINKAFIETCGKSLFSE